MSTSKTPLSTTTIPLVTVFRTSTNEALIFEVVDFGGGMLDIIDRSDCSDDEFRKAREELCRQEAAILEAQQ